MYDCFIIRLNLSYWERHVFTHPRFENIIWSQIKQIWVIFTHLKLWVAVASHNVKWVENLNLI